MFGSVGDARYGKQTKQNESVSHRNSPVIFFVGRHYKPPAIKGSDFRGATLRDVSAGTLIVRWPDTV
jgi:hypothetical protein